ncbi:MAG TPA: hypothetical protein PKV73_05940, partial [Agriterribacter sp.]|nr:hypothetical protein [Agriterribacter sp.]
MTTITENFDGAHWMELFTRVTLVNKTTFCFMSYSSIEERENESRVNNSINKFGFWAGLIAFGSTTAFVIVQVLQVMGVFYFPIDEILIYGTSLCIVIPFVL